MFGSPFPALCSHLAVALNCLPPGWLHGSVPDAKEACCFCFFVCVYARKKRAEGMIRAQGLPTGSSFKCKRVDKLYCA